MTSISGSSSVVCGACQATNDPTANFCLDCGHRLYENCGDCGKPASLTQVFCNHCGLNLKESVEKKRAQYGSSIKSAFESAKRDEFETAEGLLSAISDVQDYRYREAASLASESLVKVRELAVSRGDHARRLEELAWPKIDDADHQAVVKILQDAPFKLMSTEVEAAFYHSQECLAGQQRSHEGLKQAVAAKDWPAAGQLVDQLCETLEDDGAVRKVAAGVARKIYRRAQVHAEQRRFKNSLECLDSMPTVSGGSDLTALQGKGGSLRRWIEDLLWIEEQIKKEPFTTAELARLAKRLIELEPSVMAHKEKLSRVAKTFEEGPRSSRSLMPRQDGPVHSAIGGEVEALFRLTRIDYGTFSRIQNVGLQLNVAFGLALQALGEGSVKASFGPEKGRLKNLFKKKTHKAWGIDLGTTTVKGVLLSRVGEQFIVEDAFFNEFDSSAPRGEAEAAEKQFACLRELLAKRDLAETSVWCNLPADNMVSRFVVLPPVSNSSAKALIDREVAERLPLKHMALVTVIDQSAVDEGSEVGRPVGIYAMRKDVVDQRLKMFEELNLNVQGLQADSLALANLLTFEFEERLQEDSESEATDKAGGEKRPALAMLHSGSFSTSLVCVAKDARWVWTSQFGGSDLTSALARTLQVTRTDAESMKKKPSALANPSSEFSVVEERIDSWVASRLRSVIQQAKADFPAFDVQSTLASGGNSLTHSWIRRTMQ